MKRFLTFLTATVIVMAAMAQSSGIVLSYNKGKELKFYSESQLHLAINDAEVNDTIYFGPGTYSLSGLPNYESSSVDKLINKPLVFIGSSGYETDNCTRLNGVSGLFLSADPSLDESKKNYSFEGINLTQDYDIRLASNINELKYANSKGRIQDWNEFSKEQYSINTLIVDRCYIATMYLSQFKTKHVSVNNSRITNLYGGCDSSYGVAAFDHCYIEHIYEDFVGLVQHSLIDHTSAGTNTSFENCGLYSDNNKNSSKTECIELDSGAYDLDYDPSSLGNCNDGTLYGTTGGKTPYTRLPQYPTPDISVDPDTNKPKSYVEYDALNKKLTITIKLKDE